MALTPYLNFGGNCRAAFARYQEIFGGELFVMGTADAPGGEVPAGMEDRVVHAALMFDGHLLMASDTWDTDFPKVQGMYVSYSTPDVGEAKRVFAALSEGGSIEMPMAETFFSPAYGICTDPFGTPWMVSAEQARPA